MNSKSAARASGRRFRRSLRRSSSLICALVSAASLCVTAPESARAAIGPDAFGYTADSVPSSFEDISATGTRVLAGTDDFFVQAPIGFSFNFYGSPYTDAFPSTNGLISFGEFTLAFNNEDFRSAFNSSQALVAPLWDDWEAFTPGTDAVYFETRGAPGARRFIVQWNVVKHFIASPSEVTFQAVLFEGTNAIEYRYLDTDTGDANRAGGSATVGIRDSGGNTNGRFLQWSFNEPRIGDRTAIRFVRNRPPDCSRVTASPGTLWPPNHKLAVVSLGGATDPDGDPVTLTVTGVTQDEPVNAVGDGNTSPDAALGSSSNKVQLRAERSGGGNGRVYTVAFTARDPNGGSCNGTTTVSVPANQGGKGTAVNSAPPSYNSFGR